MDLSYESLSTNPIKDLVEICQVDITTARRWRRGSNLPPLYVLAFLNAKLTGDLGFLDPAWRKWIIRQGHLFSPENWEISMNDVLATRLKDAQISAYQSENRALKAALANAELNRLEEQPGADDWALPENWVIAG